MMHKWTKKEIQFLKENVDKYTNKELAKILDVTIPSVHCILMKNKIKRKVIKYFSKEITYTINKNGCHECNSHFIDKDGYPMKKYKGRQRAMARFIYEKYYKITIPKGQIIRHTCDNPACINPLHLKVGTNADNMKDMIDRNRSLKGSKNPNSKLNEKDIKQIRKLIKKGITINKISNKYNVTQQMIYHIKNKKLWAWLKEE